MCACARCYSYRSEDEIQTRKSSLKAHQMARCCTTVYIPLSGILQLWKIITAVMICSSVLMLAT